jgi:predicted PurR-regulated permease PerM
MNENGPANGQEQTQQAGGLRQMLTASDYRLLRFTIMLACGVLSASLIILIFWIIARVMAHFSVLLLPLAIAGVLALVLDPVVRVIQKKLHASRLFAIILLGLMLLVLTAGVYALVLPEAADQARDLRDAAPELLETVRESASIRFPRVVAAIEAELEDFEWSEMSFDLAPVYEHMSHYATLLMGMGFIPLYLFFMLLAGNHIQANARELISTLSNRQQDEIVYLVRMFIGYVTAFFQGQLIIAVIMGILLAIGFTLVGLQAAILFGLLLGLLNIVPFLGTIVGLAVTLPVAWIQPDGGLQLVGLVLLVFAAVQLIESWLLTPRIMSEKSGLHPGIVVVSLFFWGILLGGVIGMILAVPLTAFLVALWRHVKSNYLGHVVLEGDNGIEPTGTSAVADAGKKED